MASRRLKSDRFFTNDFTPEMYTQVGIDWVNNTSMKDVLLRHYPELEPVIGDAERVFAPWPKLGAPAPARRTASSSSRTPCAPTCRGVVDPVAEDFPHASVLEGIRFTAQIGAPNVILGLFTKRELPSRVAATPEPTTSVTGWWKAWCAVTDLVRSTCGWRAMKRCSCTTRTTSSSC